MGPRTPSDAEPVDPTTASEDREAEEKLDVSMNSGAVKEVNKGECECTPLEAYGKADESQSECISSQAGDGTVTAGDFQDQIDNREIDYFICAALGEKTFEAKRFYDFQEKSGRDGRQGGLRLRKEIDEKLRRHDWIMMPVWTRHHWASAFLERTAGVVRITIYDSAAHPMTASDFRKRFKELGFSQEPVVTVQHAKQPPRSNECGIHPILLSMLAAYTGRPPYLSQTSDVLDLSQLRDLFAGHYKAGTQPKLSDLLETMKESKHPLVETIRRVTGKRIEGAGPENAIGIIRSPIIEQQGSGLRRDLVAERELVTVSETDGEEVVFSVGDVQIKDEKARQVLRRWASEKLSGFRDEFNKSMANAAKELDDWRSAGKPKIEQRALRDMERRATVPFKKTIEDAILTLRDAPDYVKANAELWKAVQRAATRVLQRETVKDELGQRNELLAGRI